MKTENGGPTQDLDEGGLPPRVMVLIGPAPVPVQSFLPPLLFALGLRTVCIPTSRPGSLSFIDGGQRPDARAQSTDGAPLVRLPSNLGHLPFPKEVPPKALREFSRQHVPPSCARSGRSSGGRKVIGMVERNRSHVVRVDCAGVVDNPMANNIRRVQLRLGVRSFLS